MCGHDAGRSESRASCSPRATTATTSRRRCSTTSSPRSASPARFPLLLAPMRIAAPRGGSRSRSAGSPSDQSTGPAEAPTCCRQLSSPAVRRNNLKRVIRGIDKRPHEPRRPTGSARSTGPPSSPGRARTSSSSRSTPSAWRMGLPRARLEWIDDSPYLLARGPAGPGSTESDRRLRTGAGRHRRVSDAVVPWSSRSGSRSWARGALRAAARTCSASSAWPSRPRRAATRCGRSTAASVWRSRRADGGRVLADSDYPRTAWSSPLACALAGHGGRSPDRRPRCERPRGLHPVRGPTSRSRLVPAGALGGGRCERRTVARTFVRSASPEGWARRRDDGARA